MKFDVLPDVLVELFMVSNSVSDSNVGKRIYRSCPILFLNRGTIINLVELDMLYFDDILGIDWLHVFLLQLIVEQGKLSSNILMNPF